MTFEQRLCRVHGPVPIRVDGAQSYVLTTPYVCQCGRAFGRLNARPRVTPGRASVFVPRHFTPEKASR